MRLSDAPKFLTPDQIAAEVVRFTYRPGWMLRTFVDPWEGVCLYVVADLPDSYKPAEQTQMRIRTAIPPIPDVEYLGWWLLWRVSLIEIHEAREWLKRDGKPLSDPHDPVEPNLVG